MSCSCSGTSSTVLCRNKHNHNAVKQRAAGLIPGEGISLVLPGTVTFCHSEYCFTTKDIKRVAQSLLEMNILSTF